ncbi:MAG: antibiotic ABC transporter ATP-binding protein [Bacteroidetes bacterium 47-18]|nr:MAG: antibiotic ABC transporter ATP-binding protein [Bacteroidetes bacterium 47-18]
MIQKDNKKSGSLRKMFSFLKPYRLRFWISVVLSIILSLMAPVRPYITQLSIDHYIGNKLLQGLIYISVAHLVILLVESAIRFVFMYITSWVSQHVVNDMRNAVFKKISYQNLSYFDNTQVGTLTTRTINDLEAVNDVFSDGIVSILADLLTILAILGVMFYTDWRLTLISLAAFPLLILATYFFKESVNRSFMRVRNAVSSLNAFVQEHLTGMYIVQAFAAEKSEAEKFNEINKEHRDANIRSIMAYSVFFPVVEIILAISMGLLVWYGAVRMLNAEITQGVIIAFIMYLNQLFRPLRMLADKFNTLQMGIIAGERVITVLEDDNYLKHNGTLEASPLRGAVKLEDVCFEYKPGIPVLKGISFEVREGETVAIIGHTGAGKSSVISILTRLYEIQSGRILIDGRDINDYNIYELRRQVGVVLQDVFLFSGTILENITMNNPALTREQVVDVCKLLGIHEFIMNLPDNYDFNVRERGGTLSQGQRQLISFARALIYDPRILILDEATASIDSASEQLVQHAIGQLVKDRTAIVIAHRLSTIRKADNIIVLDKGVIIEQGNHEQLMLQDGMYAQMYKVGRFSSAGESAGAR